VPGRGGFCGNGCLHDPAIGPDQLGPRQAQSQGLIRQRPLGRGRVAQMPRFGQNFAGAEQPHDQRAAQQQPLSGQQGRAILGLQDPVRIASPPRQLEHRLEAVIAGQHPVVGPQCLDPAGAACRGDPGAG
jgi:hypothetical protein